MSQLMQDTHKSVVSDINQLVVSADHLGNLKK